MNPLHWRREHQVAALAVCLMGAIVGIIFGWFQSPVSTLYPGGFIYWVIIPSAYWHWSLLGALLAGLGFYATYLLRKSN
jgi:hypothetical protein